MSGRIYSDCAVPVYDIHHSDMQYDILGLHKITRTAVELVTAIRTLVLSVTPEPQLDTRSIVTFELISRAISSSRSSRSYHTYKHHSNSY